MMRLLFILCMLLGTSAFAQDKKLGPIEKEVITIDDSFPKEFEGQKILVQDSEGKAAGEFDRTKWRIVPRDKKVVYRQKVGTDCNCDEKKKKEEKKAAVQTGAPALKPHMVGLLLGYGYNGLTTTERELDLQVELEKSVIFGAEYAYRWNDDWTFGAEFWSNQTIVTSAGWHFAIP